jgi:hypothetical protein
MQSCKKKVVWTKLHRSTRQSLLQNHWILKQ